MAHIIKLTNRYFLQVHTGTWLVDGNPQIILFDISSGAWKLDHFKHELWETCNLGIPHLDVEANDAVILGYMVAEFIAEVKLNLIARTRIFIINARSSEKLLRTTLTSSPES